MQTYRIENLSADQVNVIAKALGELPFKESAPVISLITMQVKEQERAERDRQAQKEAMAAAAKAVLAEGDAEHDRHVAENEAVKAAQAAERRGLIEAMEGETVQDPESKAEVDAALALEPELARQAERA